MSEAGRDDAPFDIRFYAPWGRSLKVMNLCSLLGMIGIIIIGVVTGRADRTFWIMTLVVMPTLAIAFSALFAVRGYRVLAGTLLVERMGWRSRVDLTGLVALHTDSKAMAWSLWLSADSGLFCFAGHFWNRRLRFYRAFATDPSRAVVLRFTDRTVVVTPDRPEEFVSAVRKMRDLPEASVS